MSTVSFAGGAAMSAELMRAMDELARDLRRDHRDAALHEADVALHEGMAEAEAMHDQASHHLTGAIVGGSLAAVGGGIQLYGSTRLETRAPEPPRAGASCPAGPDAAAAQAQGSFKAPDTTAQDKALAQFKAHNDRVASYTQLSGTASKSGDLLKGGFDAAAEHRAGDARSHAARAAAASRRADAEQSDAQEAQKTSEKARDLHQQIVALDHASRMAVLRG